MNFLFQPINNASLIFIRIVFGILAFADVTGIWIYYHLYKDALNPDNFQFKYYGFEWVQPFPEPFMSLFFLVLMTAAIFIIIGKYYRTACAIFALGFAYSFFLEKAHYLNHGYLFIWLSSMMFFLPANRNFSGDVLRNPALKTNKTPYWTIFILQFFMATVYFYGGLAKFNADWLLEAQPLKIWLKQKGDMPLLGWIWRQEITAYLMSWGGFALDAFVVFFLLFKRTRIWAFCFVIFFHLVNLILFQIGIFPWMSLALTALFFAPTFPLKINEYLKSKFPKIGRIETWWSKKLESKKYLKEEEVEKGVTIHKINNWRLNRRLILIFLLPICLFHLTYPFRHHLLKGDVAWTEEGHRYSWRMMLRQKRGNGYFILKDKETGKTERVYPRNYLADKQKYKIYTHPDMILQFAHYLRDKWKEEKGKEVEVYAKIRCKLNHRKYQNYTDETIDLSKQEWSFLKESDWIIPLKKE